MYEIDNNDPTPVLADFMIGHYDSINTDELETLEEEMNKHNIDHYFIEPEFGSLLTKIKWPIISSYLGTYKQAVYKAFKDASQLSKGEYK
jgi:hypothetical protein